MNVMLANLLQRGNNEAKSAPLSSDAEEALGSDDFNSLMAKLDNAGEVQQGKSDAELGSGTKHDDQQAVDDNSTEEADVAVESISDKDTADSEPVSDAAKQTAAMATTSPALTNSDEAILSEIVTPDKVAGTSAGNDLLSQIAAAKQQSTSLNSSPKEVSTAVRAALQPSSSPSQVTADEVATVASGQKQQNTEQLQEDGKQKIISDEMVQEVEKKVKKALAIAGDNNTESTAVKQSPTATGDNNTGSTAFKQLQAVIGDDNADSTVVKSSPAVIGDDNVDSTVVKQSPAAIGDSNIKSIVEQQSKSTREQLQAVQKLNDEVKPKVPELPHNEAPKPMPIGLPEAQKGTGQLLSEPEAGKESNGTGGNTQSTTQSNQQQTIIYFRNKADTGPISDQLQGTMEQSRLTDNVSASSDQAVESKLTKKVTSVLNSLNPVQQKELQAVLNGDVDIYDASPSVQKAVAQLLANKNLVAVKGVNEPFKPAQSGVLPANPEPQNDSDMPLATKPQDKPQELRKVDNGSDFISPVKQLKQDKVMTNERAYQGEPEQAKVSEKPQIEKQVTEKLSEKLSDKEFNATSSQESAAVKENSKAERAPFNNIFSTTRTDAAPNATSSTEPATLNQTMKEVQQLQQSQNSSSNSAAQTKPTVDANLQQAINIARHDAAKELNQRVGMMLNLNNKQAEIRLDPPELGALQIRIKSDAEQAQVNFVVQNQQAKEMLEQSLPRLREMLAEQGIELGESHISHGQSEGQDGQGDSQGQYGSGQQGSDDEQAMVSDVQQRQQRNSDSAIDYYA